MFVLIKNAHSVCISVCERAFLCFCVCISVCVCAFLCVSVCDCAFPCVFLYVSVSVCFCGCHSLESLCMSERLSVPVSVTLCSGNLSLCLRFSDFGCVFVSFSACFSQWGWMCVFLCSSFCVRLLRDPHVRLFLCGSSSACDSLRGICRSLAFPK